MINVPQAAMRELTCIVCPIGCLLKVELTAQASGEESPADGDGLPVPVITGNQCRRGNAYAMEEIFSPKRIVTATCAVSLNAEESALRGPAFPRRIPVRTSVPCPKEKINELLKDIYSLKQELPVRAGQKLISGWKGSGIDVIASRTMGECH